MCGSVWVNKNVFLIVERKTVKPLFCMKVKRSSKNSFLFGSLSSSYSWERKRGLIKDNIFHFAEPLKNNHSSQQTDVVPQSSPWRNLGRLLLFLCYCRPHQPSSRYRSAREEKSGTNQVSKHEKVTSREANYQ